MFNVHEKLCNLFYKHKHENFPDNLVQCHYSNVFKQISIVIAVVIENKLF